MAIEQWYEYLEKISTAEFANPPITYVPPTHGSAQKITVDETEALKKFKPGKATVTYDSADLWKSRC